VSFYEQPQRIRCPRRWATYAHPRAFALLFNLLLPWRDVIGLPDMVALVLTFWCVHTASQSGDRHRVVRRAPDGRRQRALLGQHAFAYAFLAFAAVSLHRRILWFSRGVRPPTRALVLLLASQMLMLTVRLVAGGSVPRVDVFRGDLRCAACGLPRAFCSCCAAQGPGAWTRTGDLKTIVSPRSGHQAGPALLPAAPGVAGVAVLAAFTICSDAFSTCRSSSTVLRHQGRGQPHFDRHRFSLPRLILGPQRRWCSPATIPPIRWKLTFSKIADLEGTIDELATIVDIQPRDRRPLPAPER